MFNLKSKSARKGTFLSDEKGSAAIETVIMVPLTFFVIMSMFTLFDAFRQYSMHQKAAYTLSDMISRETLPLDRDYLEGAHDLFDTLTRSPQDSTVRISIVRYDAVNDSMRLDWSKTSGFSTPLRDEDVRNWTDRLPMMVNNERIIVVETYANYEPPFNTGLGTREIANFIFARPRYAPQVLWQNT
jgi:hypothetical protein